MINYKQKIIFICSEFPPGPGGIGNHACNLANEIVKHLPIDVLTVSDYTNKNSSRKFDKRQPFYIHRFQRYKYSLQTYFFRIIQIIKHINKNNYSHCILSGYFSLLMFTIIKLFNNEIIFIAVLHGSELVQSSLIKNFFLKQNLNNINIIITVSNYTKKLLPKKKINKQKVFVIPNGVNEALLNVNYNNTINEKMIGTPCLVTLGSITNRKGQINLINVLSEVIKKYPKVHYHCVGLPIEKKKITERVKQLKLKPYVTIHGFISNEKLDSIFHQTDILIMLSQNKIRNDVEGFGIAILEANLFGVPAIGSINTGIEDAIVNRKTGMLVNPYSINEILDAIEHIMKNREKLSINAVKWANQHTWGNISKRYLNVIENA